ncbi:MAG: bifunctional diaminohydroxyphosphoribosylaminopyrimidine deaminase/5-amino-6-(5-phosphoribosylamino)uracil reductase RibD [Bacteroidetes bacterium]|nr:MAG: bifunctional diaminohydroxyphosphoribosylaminopyrimidine deaminase/5-amino-6-(5-phosphoribosylamino)uracil reductase RibD [Bacteroidota bacterium]
MNVHSKYMSRCIQLAQQGAGFVAPNPMVGAVLVYEEKIIGEGYHQQYGGPHAEVNCIESVKEEDKNLIPNSTLYVSLEPCAHFGKTPPCSDLIIRNKIHKVIIGCRDPFKEVDGKGIEKLRSAGVEVELGVLENECRELNKRFFIFHTEHRPYIILKWAQTADDKIASATNERLLISNEYTNRLVHKWRSEEASIIVGTNTALLDDPELTNRYWSPPSPVRLVVDMDLSLPRSLKLFDQKNKTIVFNAVKQDELENLLYYHVTTDVSLVHQLLNALYQLKISSVLVEGGAKLLQSFIDEELWDEIRVIKNEELIINNGLQTPLFNSANPVSQIKIESDTVSTYYH